MAYAAGDTITAALYNVLVSNSSSPYGYNHFAGEGSGEYGLGQTELATVAGNDNKTTIAPKEIFITSTNKVSKKYCWYWQ